MLKFSCRKRKTLINTKRMLPRWSILYSYCFPEQLINNCFGTWNFRRYYFARKEKPLELLYKIFFRKTCLFRRPSEIVEIDETVLCRRVIIRYPTTAYDESKDIICILGAIKERNN
ncbi:hypothetical protein DMUE_5907 [Dictyocoela muelleri]|nr:hypothetical protein DMUE_5907 [Dictyocoela muelleri]